MVSNSTGLPLPDVTADDPGGFGLGLGRFYRKELGGGYWFYEGETLGFRTIFAYWPQFDLLTTGAVNSRAPNARRGQVRSRRDRRRVHGLAAGASPRNCREPRCEIMCPRLRSRSAAPSMYLLNSRRRLAAPMRGTGRPPIRRVSGYW